MHYFNDKPCFLMLNLAHYTLSQNTTLEQESMLKRSVSNKNWRPDIKHWHFWDEQNIESIAKFQCLTN